MDRKLKSEAENIYLILAGLFIASLVTSNLIFQKFFSLDILGIYTFELSVGILPYPLTFLVTDIISEVYGKKRAQKVVISGLFASIFMLFIIIISSSVNATDWSPISNLEFDKIFGFTFVAVAASLTAYLIAQFIDVQLFHFWKNLTKGKHLWLRNNASTFCSQFIDTFTVLILLCTFGVIKWELFGILLLSGYLFKVIIAIIDTPIIYFIVYLFKRRFKLKNSGDELQF